MGQRMKKIREFFLREKDEDQLPREYLAEAIEDLFNQLDDVQVVRVMHDNLGPMGGESSQINAMCNGRWVTVNVYGS